MDGPGLKKHLKSVSWARADAVLVSWSTSVDRGWPTLKKDLATHSAILKKEIPVVSMLARSNMIQSAALSMLEATTREISDALEHGSKRGRVALGRASLALEIFVSYMTASYV